MCFVLLLSVWMNVSGMHFWTHCCHASPTLETLVKKGPDLSAPSPGLDLRSKSAIRLSEESYGATRSGATGLRGSERKMAL